MIASISLGQVFSTFSRRPRAPRERKRLTHDFKTRTLMLCSERHPISSAFGSPSPFWSEIHTKLRYLLARPQLSDLHSNSHFEDIEVFLRSCTDENFLDFIEYIFQTQEAPPPFDPRPEIGHVLPSEINKFFDLCVLPYYVTDYDWESNRARGETSSRLVARPQIITRDSEVIHEMATEPSRNLLRAPRWKTANEEFSKALQHYRKNEWEDCVAMCASSLESVMKIVCKEKGWEKKPDSLQAAQLLKVVVTKSNLDPYYVKLLELPHVIRNTRSNVHGRGNLPTTLPQHVAQFVVNMTSSTILLIVEEANL